MDGRTMNDQSSDYQVGGAQRNEIQNEALLNDLFRAYRNACPDPEPSVSFMPDMWAKIEAREASSTIFSRFAKTLVTAALGASVLMGLLSASYNEPAPASEGSYIQALAADHASSLEPLQVERISEMEQ